MSSFYCDKCGAVISDTPGGYTTGCEHYPQESRARAEANYKAGLQRIQKRDRTAAPQSSTAIPSTAPFLPKGVGQEGTVDAAAPTGGFDRTASHSTGTYQEFDAPTPRTDDLYLNVQQHPSVEKAFDLMHDHALHLERELDHIKTVEFTRRIDKVCAGWKIKTEKLERELAEANAKLRNYEHGTARMCADAAIGAAKEWQKEAEALKVDAERYKDYANVLRLFIEGVEWDSELPLDVWAICQHWNNNAAIDAARGEK